MNPTDFERKVAARFDLLWGIAPPDTLKAQKGKDLKDFLLSVMKEVREDDRKDFERVCRLYLQGAWNDQSEIQALSPEGKEIIWGGIFGAEITKEWEKIKSRLKPSQ